MKKILYSALLTIIVLVIVSCATKRKFLTTFFEVQTKTPELIIDSICASNLIPENNDFYSWSKSMYIGSDSVMTEQYTRYTQKEDTTYIFTVIKIQGDSICLIKFRKE